MPVKPYVFKGTTEDLQLILKRYASMHPQSHMPFQSLKEQLEMDLM